MPTPENHLLDDIVYEDKKRRYARYRLLAAYGNAIVQMGIMAWRFFVPRALQLSWLHYGLFVIGVLLICFGIQSYYFPPKPPESNS